MDDDLRYSVALLRIPGIGRTRFSILGRAFGTMREAWEATPGALRAAGLDDKAVSAIAEGRPGVSPDQEIERLAQAQVRAIAINDPAYPPRLKEIFDPPPLLYIKGTLVEQDRSSITMVGTRSPSAYGREVAATLAADLGQNGITVVSGLARGIDAAAHSSALQAGGRTIAVQACGLDMVYPPGHAGLAKRIVENGAVVSDYPLGTRPRAEYFPRRNRILAGLTLGTLVIEAGKKSGALITSKFAGEEGREVLAVPGSIFSPVSLGTNLLIQDGAKAVLSVNDILEELNVRVPAQQLQLPNLPDVSGAEAALLQHVPPEPTHIDLIRRSAGLPIEEVSGTLAVLELKGVIKQVNPTTYALVGRP